MLTGLHYPAYELGKFWDIPPGDSPIFIPSMPSTTQTNIPSGTQVPPNTTPVSPGPTVPMPTTGAGTSATQTPPGPTIPSDPATTTSTNTAPSKVTIPDRIMSLPTPVLVGGAVAVAGGALFVLSRLLR